MDLSMWEYWRDKYGTVTALERYYPELLKDDTQLSVAAAQIKNSEAAIDARMLKLQELDETASESR